MKRSLILLFTACALLVVGAAATSAREQAGAKGSIRPAGRVAKADLPGLAGISFDDALKAARSACPGQVIQAELEVEDGCLMYSFEIVVGDKSITEVEIDAGNGKVLGTEKESAEEGKDSKD